ncbi:hypothetical protein ACOMHN_050691 [Nucella lapillus]
MAKNSRHRGVTPSLPFLLLLLLPALLGDEIMVSAVRRQRPHIVVIMADDLGWSDVSFRNPERRTPNIDNMARAGVELKYSYMQQVCTPSRSAFMSGIYPFRMGLQNSVLSALQNSSMPVNVPVLPERMQALGYSTHYVGKWHLGFCNPAMTPTRRGFDTFYGMYLGKGGYYNHTSKWDGYDFHDDVSPDSYRVAWEGNGTYSTELFTDRAVEIVENHDTSTPLFLFLSYQAVHGPLEVPDSYLPRCQHMADPDQRIHCAMTAVMDDGIGRLNQSLIARGMADNLIMMFTTDNGGPIKLGSTNWPLRGSKITLWEGGTRGVTLLHSATHLPDAPYTWDGLIHAVDWFPTLLRAAGDRSRVANIDGVDSWRKIVRNRGRSSRTSFIYNIDDVKNTSALRYRQYKLINNSPGKPDGWYNPPGNGADELPEPGPYPEFMLFDIETDPEERTNLIEQRGKARLIATMKAMLNDFKEGLVPTVEAPKVNEGKPRFHNGSWVTGWC